MNLAPGSWARFLLGVLLAPLALLGLGLVVELLAMVTVHSEAFSPYRFTDVASRLARPFLTAWACLSAMLAVMV